MRLSELREKEVINLCTCKRLGYADDIVFDLCEGCVKAIVVPEHTKFYGLFGSSCEYIIPIDCIKRTGEDFIMVEISEEKCKKSCGGY